MTDKKHGRKPQEEASQPSEANQSAVQSEIIIAYEQKLAELDAKIKEQDDRYLRMLAEYDNYKKRTQSDALRSYTGAMGDTILAFLPVVDNLERACASPGVDSGIKMIMKQMHDILDKFGVKAVGAVGESFDPNMHNAVMHEENPDHGDNIITEVLEKGYTYGERLMRPAMVKTAN